MKVKVKDTGVGIDREDLGKLFTRFGKLQRTADINHEGVGLGLTIVKQIVELAGGQVSVRSKGIGFGTTFEFKINLMPEAQDN